MSYDSLLINTCSIKRKAIDKWGESTESTISNIACRFMNIIKRITDFNGEEKVSAGKFFFKPDITIYHSDLITYDGRDYAILKINKPQDASSHHHTEVWVA